MRLLSLFFLGALGFVLAGCGGSGSALKSLAKTSPTTQAANSSSGTANVSRKGKGQATVTVKWPARASSDAASGKAAHSRLIPVAANSIRVALTTGTPPVASTLLTRPGGVGAVVSTYTFANLAPGSLTAKATAFPNADGSGTAQAASATSALTIVDGQDASLVLTMDSTVTILDVTAAGGATSVAPSATLQLTATPRDATGAVVLTTATNLQWSSSDPTKASIDVNGQITGVATGSVTITATDTEHQKVGTFTIAIIILTASTFCKAAASRKSHCLVPGRRTEQPAVEQATSAVISASQWTVRDASMSATTTTIALSA